MAFPTLNNGAPNFPPPLQKNSKKGLIFPSDLVATGRNFYTSINFVDYSWTYSVNSYGSTYMTPSGDYIKLPIPLKLNDNLMFDWNQVSLTKAMMDTAGTGISTMLNNSQNQTVQKWGNFGVSALQLLTQVGGIGAGIALNPLMFMQFQQPNFRSFSLSWVLTAKNHQESENIKNIIIQIKKAASPTRAGILMGYPQIAIIKMRPDDIFGLMKFKPCVVTSVQADYTAGPTPSFFNDGAPTVVTLTVNLTEMQFWFRDEIE